MEKSRVKSLLPFAIALIVISPLLLINKLNAVLFVNGCNTVFLDFLFKNTTLLGEGIMVGIAFVFVLFRQVKWLLVFIIGVIIHLVILRLGKYELFADMYRPLHHLKGMGKEDLLHFVDGVVVNIKRTFPSGHTLGATFGASMIAIMLNKKVWSWLMVIIGLSVGYSRMYLGQHFFMDIYFGFFFGTLSTCLAYLIVQKLSLKYAWLNKNLIVIKSNKKK